MEKNKPKIAIIGAGSEAEAKVALLKEKFGDDLILVDGDTILVNGATISRDFQRAPNPFEAEPMYIRPHDMIPMEHLEDLRYSHLSRKERDAEIIPVRTEPKIQRNAPCPCGSGKKYKKCCEGKK